MGLFLQLPSGLQKKHGLDFAQLIFTCIILSIFVNFRQLSACISGRMSASFWRLNFYASRWWQVTIFMSKYLKHSLNQFFQTLDLFRTETVCLFCFGFVFELFSPKQKNQLKILCLNYKLLDINFILHKSNTTFDNA